MDRGLFDNKSHSDFFGGYCTSTFKLIDCTQAMNRNGKFKISEKKIDLLSVIPHPVMVAGWFE
jgi:hypothetical protein